MGARSGQWRDVMLVETEGDRRQTRQSHPKGTDRQRRKDPDGERERERIIQERKTSKKA